MKKRITNIETDHSFLSNQMLSTMRVPQPLKT